MKFCLITTFFGEYSFGGDAIAVERLAAALLRRGHDVHVIYPRDAYQLLNKHHLKRTYYPSNGLVVHAIESPLRSLSPLYIHQTGRLGDLYRPIKQILDTEDFDVIHVHNISLVGGLGLIDLISTYNAMKFMTTHEYWLLCPLSSLWQFNQQVCENPQCFRCTLSASRPPQLWRTQKRIQQSIEQLDSLISASAYTLNKHAEQKIIAKRMTHIPLFLPDSWIKNPTIKGQSQRSRPFFLAVGRLVIEKGFQTLLPIMANFPDVDLVIAGDGNYSDTLKQKAQGFDNIHFVGHLDHNMLSQLYRDAVALLAPSLVLETFGFVIIEAMSHKTPVIARNRSAYQELIADSGGGITYNTDAELIRAMQLLLEDIELRDQLGKKGQEATKTIWSEENHMQLYVSLIKAIKDE